MKAFNDIGWKENPFILKIDPKLFTGYSEQVKAALTHIGDKHKIALVAGPTGSGKTTFLKWIDMTNKHNTLYVSKPPHDPNMFVDIFISHFPLGLFEKLLKKKPNLYDLPKYLNRKMKGQLVFLLDEAHETNKEVLEWLRVLIDQIDGVTLIMAGMPVLESKIKTTLETLDQRITTRIELNALSKSETSDLIKKRIEDVGGSGLDPFTESAVDKIYQKTGGFPREVLKMCDRVVDSALGKDLTTIDASDIEEIKQISLPKVRVEQPVVTFSPKPPSEEQFRNLPYKQRKILELLSKKDWLTPGAIVDDLGFKSYRSKSHGIRSINNILNRLMKDGYVHRESRGKAFMYALTPKVKTLFVEM